MTIQTWLRRVVEINKKIDGDQHKLLSSAELESALFAVFMVSFDATGKEIERYPTITQKAAQLLFRIAAAHAFRDGNKRTAWLTMVTFLELHGIVLSEERLGYQDDLVVNLVKHELNCKDVEIWIANSLRP